MIAMSMSKVSRGLMKLIHITNVRLAGETSFKRDRGTEDSYIILYF